MNRQNYIYEAEVIEGLEATAQAEVKRLRGAANLAQRRGALQFTYDADPRHLFALRSVIAVSSLHTFEIPRPKALLGQQNLTTLTALMRAIIALHPRRSFSTLSIDAAGSDSSVMIRLRDELAQSVALAPAPLDERGDFVVRLRRASRSQTGWDVLLRLTPRPLITRPWRVCNYEGALNASAAYGMVTMLRPRRDDTFLNAACGSGSLLIERLHSERAAYAVGVDHAPEALACAAQNIEAAQLEMHPTLIQAELTALPFVSGSFNALCADLPFGQLVGSHEANRVLYPAALKELARVARANARLAVLTHEVRLMENVLKAQRAWRLERAVMITLRGLHPRIYLLHKF